MEASLDVHSRARKKRQQMHCDAEASDAEEHSDSNGDVQDAQKPAADDFNDKKAASSPADDGSTSDSLFSSCDDEPAKEPADPNINHGAEPENDDSNSDLFSSSSESVKVIAITKPTVPTTPPNNIAVNKTDVSPAISGVTFGCHDGESDDSLFSHDDDDAPPEELNGHEPKVAATKPAAVEKTPPKPAYLTFDRPTCKPDVESDDESSDEGSLFSLNEHKDEKPSAKIGKKGGDVKSTARAGSFAIPRKKSLKSHIAPAMASIAVKQDRSSRLCHKFSRQSSQELHPDDVIHPVDSIRKRSMPKKGVSFATTVKQPKKFLGKSSRALKTAPFPEEDFGTDRSMLKSTPTKTKDQDGIYFDWQKSPKERLWNKEFVRVKNYIREHGNCDTPDGHSLSAWIRKQQKMGRSLARNAFDWGIAVPGDDFQTFVHVYRLQNIGFDWGDDRRCNSIQLLIKDWTETLDETQRIVMLGYGDKPSPSVARRTKQHAPLNKKRQRDDDSDRDIRKIKKSEHKDEESIPVINGGFVDERPKKISWISKAKKQSRWSNVQLSSAVRNQALEMYKKQNNGSDTIGNAEQRGCWFGLEFAALEGNASNQDIIPKESDLKTKAKPKRLWSEVEKLWTEVEFSQSIREPIAAEPAASPTVTFTATASKAVDPVEDTTPKTTPPTTTPSNSQDAPSAKSPRKSSQHDKHPTASSRFEEIPMVPSQDFSGWYTRYVPRKSSKFASGDYYYYSPERNFMFRSRPEVRRFLEILDDKNNEDDAMDEYKSRYSKSPSKKKRVQAKENNATNKSSEGNATHHGSVTQNNAIKTIAPPPVQKKRVLSVGDQVYAAWQKNKKQKSPVFYLGVVLSSKSGSDGINVYDVLFDDGDKSKDIDECNVIPKDQYLNNSLKHIYSIGDKVYSAWWPAKHRKAQPAWYPGTIKGRRVMPRGGKYGPSVLYDISFDDGDSHLNVEDEFVFLRSDYLFSTKQLENDKSEWIGVRNVVDKTSSDPWAKVVGWYVANIDGSELTFPLLTDALRAYDSHTVSRLGSKTRRNDLNLPDEWTFSASKAPSRSETVSQIAGSKLIVRAEQQTPSRTVKRADHIMRWKAAESEARVGQHKVDSSDCNSDSETDENDLLIGESTCKKKPGFKKGEKVYALWSGADKWYPGRIWDIHVIPHSDRGYGLQRTFDIIYDDMEKETEVGEIYVMKKVDYELCLEKGEANWIGVKNVTDPDSEDAFARAVGWYEVNFEDSDDTYAFGSLQEALRYYDKSLIKQRGTGAKVSASEINFPAELKTYLEL